MQPFTRTASREMYRNDWMTLREDDIRRPRRLAGRLRVIDRPDYALVIHLHDERLCLVNQYRYPLGERRRAQSVAAYARLLLWERNTR